MFRVLAQGFFESVVDECQLTVEIFLRKISQIAYCLAQMLGSAIRAQNTINVVQLFGDVVVGNLLAVKPFAVAHIQNVNSLGQWRQCNLQLIERHLDFEFVGYN